MELKSKEKENFYFNSFKNVEDFKNKNMMITWGTDYILRLHSKYFYHLYFFLITSANVFKYFTHYLYTKKGEIDITSS